MKRINTYPVFLYLLPIFFYLVGISEYGFHPTLSKLVIPLVLMLVFVGALHLAIFRVYQNNGRIFIMSFLVFSMYLFFGNIKDTIPQSSIFHSYFVVLALLLVILLTINLYLRNRNKIILQFFAYLNLLLVLLTLMQFALSVKNIKECFRTHHQIIRFSKPILNRTPSIYFILFDEYPGTVSLKEYYQFGNEALIDHLRQHDFHVFDTMNSNYDKTIYSINSILNLQYLDMASYLPVNRYAAYLKNFTSIKRNVLTSFLEKQGYRIHNLSLFDLGSHQATSSYPLLKTSNEPLQKNMFHNKLKDDLLWKLYSGKFRVPFLYDRYLLHVHHQNNEIIKQTIAGSAKKNQQPFFHYAHLLMPHEPIFTDSNGKLYDMEREQHLTDISRKGLDYLKYTNRRMMQLSDTLVKNDPGAIIILLSDHGYGDTPETQRKLHCNNFMAIHLPDADYARIGKLRSNVNLFRIILNQYFGQQLPLQKDSCYSINEEENRIIAIKPI